MDWSISFDILFLVLALFVLPTPSLLSSHSLPPPPSAKFFSADTPNANSPMASPLPSPMVPTITLTPDTHPKIRHGAGHKRKSVSFSLSSMDEIAPPPHTLKKRPPTPFVSGPVSPLTRSAVNSPLPVLSPTTRNIHAVDPMGVQKSWLMP